LPLRGSEIKEVRHLHVQRTFDELTRRGIAPIVVQKIKIAEWVMDEI
jgi:hypothetical protein